MWHGKNIEPSVSVLGRARNRWTRTVMASTLQIPETGLEQQRDFKPCHGTATKQNATVQGKPLSRQWADVSLCGLVRMRRKS